MTSLAGRLPGREAGDAKDASREELDGVPAYAIGNVACCLKDVTLESGSSTRSSSSSSSGVGLPFRDDPSDVLCLDQVPFGSIVTCSSFLDVDFKMLSTYLI